MRNCRHRRIRYNGRQRWLGFVETDFGDSLVNLRRPRAIHSRTSWSALGGAEAPRNSVPQFRAKPGQMRLYGPQIRSNCGTRGLVFLPHLPGQTQRNVASRYRRVGARRPPNNDATANVATVPPPSARSGIPSGSSIADSSSRASRGRLELRHVDDCPRVAQWLLVQMTNLTKLVTVN